jgi:hypothetical protein
VIEHRPNRSCRGLKSRPNDEAEVQNATDFATVVACGVSVPVVGVRIHSSSEQRKCRRVEQRVSGLLTSQDGSLHSSEARPAWRSRRGSQRLALREQLRCRALAFRFISRSLPVSQDYIREPENIDAGHRSLVRTIGVCSQLEVEHHHGCLLGSSSWMGTLGMCIGGEE